MKTETRAKIQEAKKGIVKAINSISQRHDPFGDRFINQDLQDNLDLISKALAAEPDEPTVSKSVEELVKRLSLPWDWMLTNPMDIQKTIQQFLDAQIAERDKRITEARPQLPDA